MSLPDSLLSALDNPDEFKNLTENFLKSRQLLIDQLSAEQDLASLSTLLKEDRQNLSLMTAELVKIRDVMVNIKKIEQYTHTERDDA
ncbi:hypothetical protein [Legionella sp. CNM-4043-24]|uniref:hypothetical protein n=1 Tax=Legionella sp. CNM-4043-24 TaxID=3421646 RepID=UPI00403AFBA5